MNVSGRSENCPSACLTREREREREPFPLLAFPKKKEMSARRRRRAVDATPEGLVLAAKLPLRAEMSFTCVEIQVSCCLLVSCTAVAATFATACVFSSANGDGFVFDGEGTRV